MRQYRHISFCIAFVLAIVGCSKTDLDEVGNLDQAIRFTSSVVETRATVTDDDKINAEGSKFMVAAFKSSSNGFYFDDEMTREGSAWRAESGYTRYWPVGDKLDFFAYSPLNSFITQEGGNVYGDYSLRYKCPAEIDDQVDLLVKTLHDQEYSEISSVPLKFDHALSSIKFKVTFKDESNITLKDIDIHYVNIEKERVYNFATGEWGGSLGKYFDVYDGLSTILEVNQKATAAAESNNVVIENIPNQLMIIPQPIVSTTTISDIDDSHYLSVKLSYTLNSGSGETAEFTDVETGVMPLPAPTADNLYEMGKAYTYHIIVNGEEVSIGVDVDIEDQVPPYPAYGNIDLRLFPAEKAISYDAYNSAIDPFVDGNLVMIDPTYVNAGNHLYYTSAERAAKLLDDDVRDFVVVGRMSEALGHYGSFSSPFFIAATSLGMMPDYTVTTDTNGNVNLEFTKDSPTDEFVTIDPDHLFSIDLRGLYGFPTFGETHAGDTTLQPNAPILTGGIFKDLPLLDEVIFPHGLKAIGQYAFQNCISLGNVDLSDVEHVENGAFVDCVKLTTVKNGNLKRIHDYGFDDCKSLESIDLSGVVQVDQYGFVDCKMLKDVNLTELKIIGPHAFERCSSLTLVGGDIPEFTSVADYAFSGCEQLGVNGSHIDLTKAEHVGDHAFNLCRHLRLAIEDDDTDDIINMDVLGIIENNAFANCALIGSEHEVSLAGLTSVGVSSFLGCNRLNIVNGLQNLTTIPISAFEDCTNLKGYSNKETDDAKKVLKLPKVTEIGALAFNATGLTKVDFTRDKSAKKLTKIGEHAFSGCTSLTNIDGMGDVTEVGDAAFSGCSALEVLDLPALTDEYCGDFLFSSCTSLKRLSLPQITDNYAGTNGDDTANTVIAMAKSSDVIEEINLPALNTTIEDWGGFQDKKHLRIVNLAAVTSVGNGMFQNCSALESVDLSSVRSVGLYAFKGCSALKRLFLPEVTGSFGSWGDFSSNKGDGTLNSSLVYAYLPLVTEIGGGTFADNKTLVAIDLSSVTTLNGGALQGCTSLKRLKLTGLKDPSNLPLDWALPNAEDSVNCEIWLSPEQASNVGVDAGTGKKSWNNRPWAAIHISDGVEFELIK